MAAKLTLKLLLHKEKNRVVFAECDQDFVDILFSFLTLPMGTIVRLLGKQAAVGCMDKLYESVENLDTQYLQTEACKTMLLQPRSASEIQCEDLAINVNDVEPRRVYRCSKWDCFTRTHRLFATVPGARCRCGQAMDKTFEWVKRKVDNSDDGGGNGVFVKGAARVMISDDLHVMPISTGAVLSLLQRLGIKDADALQNRTIDVSKDQILSLLKRTLLSKTPLTDVFVDSMNLDSDIKEEEEEKESELIDSCRMKEESEAADGAKVIHVRLLESKSHKKVVYAEAGEDLVNLLFSFLTFPLGSIVKLLNKHSSLGCADHLYQSAEALSLGGEDFIKSEECKNLLLSPMLATHFGCSNRPLRIDEKLCLGATVCCCEIYYKEDQGYCSHGLKVILSKLNPKLTIPGTEHGGGFAKGSVKFMVTDKMTVIPFSPISAIDTIKELQVPISSLVEREIACGAAEVLNLLKACLHSRSTVMSDVFSLKKWRRMPLA